MVTKSVHVRNKGDAEPRAVFNIGLLSESDVAQAIADFTAELKKYGAAASGWYNAGKTIAAQAKVRLSLPDTGNLETAKAQELADSLKPGERVSGVKSAIGATAADFGKSYAALVQNIKAGVPAALEVQAKIAAAKGNMDTVNKLVVEYGATLPKAPKKVKAAQPAAKK